MILIKELFSGDWLNIIYMFRGGMDEEGDWDWALFWKERENAKKEGE